MLFVPLNFFMIRKDVLSKTDIKQIIYITMKSLILAQDER